MPIISDNLSLPLLASALVLFLISTRQWPLWMRLTIWLAGAAALGTAAHAVLLDPEHFGLLRAAEEAASRGQESALALALVGNLHIVAPALLPMFDLFWLLGAVVAILALIALTPGEALEHALRPFTAAVIGAIGGGLLALAIVAIGFGGATKRGVYVALGEDIDVIDGDTLRMGVISLRLYGIDAPEHDQVCFHQDGAQQNCGLKAENELRVAIRDAVVVCQPPETREETIPQETLGRPLVSCSARRPGVADVDLANHLAAHGWVEGYRNRRGQERTLSSEELREAQRRRWGIWATCSLKPSDWRSTATRDAFLRDEALPATAALGDCSWHPSFNRHPPRAP